MKEIFKNPVFYYVLVPLAAAIWPLMLVGIYKPNAEAKQKEFIKEYENSQKAISEILTLDPERVDYQNSKKGKPEFDYAVAVDAAAKYCDIKSNEYELSSKPARRSGGQKTEDCRVVLSDIGIEKLAKFLSTIQIRWANLQCSNLTLNKKKGAADLWKVDLEFTYYH